MPMPKIFFSYRVADEKDFVFRIYDRFEDHYGIDNVFISPDKIRDGAMWEDRIEAELKQCDVIVAIIGPKWQELLEKKKKEDGEDFVVKEIAHGLTEDKLLLPIRIKNAQMPETEALPEKIQGLRYVQYGEPVNADASFRESVEKRIHYINDEMTGRGFVWGNLRLERILRLPLSDLNLHILNEIAAGKATSVTMLMRDFVPYIHSLSQESGDALYSQIETAFDRLFVFGAAFVQDGQHELHLEFLECIRDIYDRITESENFRNERHQILLNLGNSWYIHGAILLREKMYSWLPTFLTQPMRREPHHYESSQWFYNLETPVAERGLLNGCGFIKTAHEYVKSNPYLVQLFAGDDNKALGFLCQLDFSRVLTDCIADTRLKARQSFYHYYHDRTMPLVKRLLVERGLRESILGITVDDDRFLQCLKQVIEYTYDRPGYVGFWNGSGYSIDRHNVSAILDKFQRQ